MVAEKYWAVGVRGIKLGKDDYIEEIFLMDDGTEFTMEYKGKNIDFAKMKMAHRDTKGVKVRVCELFYRELFMMR